MAEGIRGRERDAGEAPLLRGATDGDLEDVFRLLKTAGLPLEGVEESLSGFLVIERDGELIGVAGLETHGRDGVLRSVAVARARRGHGLGRRLTRGILDAARASGLHRLYLLTETAEGYFSRFGFRRIEREAASPAVQESVEFRVACPASAVAMVLELSRDTGV